MTHALAAFITQRMDQRGLRNRDVVAASGLSRALVSKYVTDSRETLSRLPAKETLDGLARALGVSGEFLLGKAIEALGLGYTSGDFVSSVETASDQELLEELSSRLARRVEPVDRTALWAALVTLERRGGLPADLQPLRNHIAHSHPDALDGYLASADGVAAIGRVLQAMTTALRPLPEPELEQVEAFLAGDDARVAALQERAGDVADAARDRGKVGGAQTARERQDRATERPDPEGPEYGA